MSIQDIDAVLATAMVGLIHRCIEDAAETAAAAKAHADNDQMQKSVNLILSLVQPISEVLTLLNAAAVMRRVSRDSI